MSKEKKIEYKTFEFKIGDVEERENEGVIEGYASTFGNIDLGLDVVDKGAFKKTIKDSKGRVPILADHSPYDQIGWNEEAKEDATGLWVRGALDLNVQKAKERYSLSKKALKLGAKMGLSIGYMTITAEPNRDNPRVRHLKELKLFEYSLVTFPMNTEAMVTAAKSIGAIDKARVLIEQLKSQGVSLKDLEIALRYEAAQVDEDPTKISQSIDNLINKFRNG
jgi:HK97 family phage prohead protease